MPEPVSAIAQRARDSIDLPAEIPSTEFKSSGTFESLKFSIAKTAMAMANLRDGGLIIIGVAQDEDRSFVVTGVTDEHASTYVQETVYKFVNAYASPLIDLRVVQIDYQEKRFIVISAPPFERTPVVCRKNTPDSTNKNGQMRSGDFFVRTGDRVETKRVQSAEMMSDLLEIAVIRRIAEQERLRRGAATEGAQARRRFENEVEDIGDLF